jgi:uncharacterized membrane protein
MVKNIESKVLMKLPGYSVIRTITSGLDPEDAGNMKPVVVTLGSIQRLGYETEKLADGRSVVFLPGTPNPWSGISQVMAADHVEYISMSVMDMVDFHERYGNGSQELLDNVLVKNSPGNAA